MISLFNEDIFKNKSDKTRYSDIASYSVIARESMANMYDVTLMYSTPGRSLDIQMYSMQSKAIQVTLSNPSFSPSVKLSFSQSIKPENKFG